MHEVPFALSNDRSVTDKLVARYDLSNVMMIEREGGGSYLSVDTTYLR